jgi:hypothetical protein
MENEKFVKMWHEIKDLFERKFKEYGNSSDQGRT